MNIELLNKDNVLLDKYWTIDKKLANWIRFMLVLNKNIDFQVEEFYWIKIFKTRLFHISAVINHMKKDHYYN